MTQVSSISGIVLSAGDTMANKGLNILIWTVSFLLVVVVGQEYIWKEAIIQGEKAEKNDENSKQNKKIILKNKSN